MSLFVLLNEFVPLCMIFIIKFNFKVRKQSLVVDRTIPEMAMHPLNNTRYSPLILTN